MEYINARKQDIDVVWELVHETIKTVYPKYYPAEVVDFFCEHHCKENIARDVNDGKVGLLVVDKTIVGTGCYRDNHITRVYVKPQYQGKGYGSFIMQCLEEEIAENYDSVELDFYYTHINTNNQLKVGKCHSIPRILDNGKLELTENWKWLNGDESEGKSTIIEQ